MKKKTKRLLIITILLVIVIITLIAGKSYSKYLNEIYGKGEIKVADWSFLVNGSDSKITDIKLIETYKKETLKENTIAPGTHGAFDIVIDATGSEVGIEYTVKFENETNKPSNLKFMYNNNIVNSIKELESMLEGEILIADNEKIKTMKIEWIWQYETGENQEEIEKNDEIDTNEGKTLENYRFDVVVVGNQIVPEI